MGALRDVKAEQSVEVSSRGVGEALVFFVKAWLWRLESGNAPVGCVGYVGLSLFSAWRRRMKDGTNRTDETNYE